MATFIRPWTQSKLAAKGMLLFVLGALLLSQFSTTTHQLAVLHARCIQHGEIVELTPGHSLNSGLAAQTSQFFATEGATNTPHQHCPLLSSRAGNSIFRLQPLHSVERPVWREPAHRSLADLPEVTITVYLNAPKHSPPAA